MLVTLDKDFGRLAIALGAPHSGILRLANIAARDQAAIINSVVAAHGDELALGAIVTVESGRIRIRLTPPTKEGDATQ